MRLEQPEEVVRAHLLCRPVHGCIMETVHGGMGWGGGLDGVCCGREEVMGGWAG